ncbi:MAG: BlaI/MecI/CopY family transcriptional regulator [Verrucomicrobiaceae bacterium]|jgi:predicted transcriptional regulator|nr:BlaI/MecI/CopY family transcriptional regulator [Verrucomicrobiaceae bacterium]
MSEPDQLSRRERQIMNVLHAEGSASVATVQEKLPDPPTDMAVRRLMHILEEKGHVKRLGKDGREVIYAPAQSKARAGLNALRQVLDTFFGGAMDEALAAHLTRKDATLTDEQVERMQRLIDEARKEGR